MGLGEQDWQKTQKKNWEKKGPTSTQKFRQGEKTPHAGLEGTSIGWESQKE